MPISLPSAMSKTELVTAILVGSAALAVWLDVKLGERSPQSLSKIVLHGAGAILAVQFVGTIGPMLIDPGSTPRTMLALFAVVLPGWTYAFLATYWVMKLMRSAITR